MTEIILLFFLMFILGLSISPLLIGVFIRAFGPERSQKWAKRAVWLGLKAIHRPVLTFNLGHSLTLKRRRYDEKHSAYYVSFGGFGGGVKRYLFDPHDRIHRLFGVPIGFVDELYGAVVDPRDLVVGHELAHDQENGTYEFRVERGNAMLESVKAVFAVPRGTVGVKLTDAWRLVGGSVDAQILDYIRDLYEKSQEPRAQATAFRQLLLPVGTFLAVFLIGAFVAPSGGGGGGPGPSPPVNESTINIGSSMLLLLASLSSLKAVTWRDQLVRLVLLGAGAGLVGLFTLALPIPIPVLGIVLPLGTWAVVMFAIGLVLPPLVTWWLGRSLGPIGKGLGKLYITLGFALGWDRPVIEFDDGEYDIVEYDSREWQVEPTLYRFAMRWVGVALANDEGNWPRDTTMPADDVERLAAAGGVQTDGGSRYPSPSGYTVTDEIAVGDIMGFVPNDPPDDHVFVRTDRTTGWLYEAGQDRRLFEAALLTAKREFEGGRKPIDDRFIMAATFGAMVLGIAVDWVVFFS